MSVLVVASKVKALVKKKGLRTSQEAIDALSKAVERAITLAVDNAKADGRETIKERDFNAKEED